NTIAQHDQYKSTGKLAYSGGQIDHSYSCSSVKICNVQHSEPTGIKQALPRLWHVPAPCARFATQLREPAHQFADETHDPLPTGWRWLRGSASIRRQVPPDTPLPAPSSPRSSAGPRRCPARPPESASANCSLTLRHQRATAPADGPRRPALPPAHPSPATRCPQGPH